MRRVFTAFLAMLCVAVTAMPAAWALGNHSDVLRDQYGRALGGATVTVYQAGTLTLAEIYSDNGVTFKANPFQTDAFDGRYNFYAVNGVYDLVFSHPNATFNPDHTKRISVIDASAVTGGGGSQGLDANFDIRKDIDGATSEANCFRVGSATSWFCIYHDVTDGLMFKPSPLADTVIRAWTNMRVIFKDVENACDGLIWDPDAASPNAAWQFGCTASKPLISFLLPLEPRGAATSATESIVTNQPKQWYLTVTDANTDAADFAFPVTAKMAGATTATFRLIGVSKNASPSGNIDLDCAMTTVTPGTDTFAAHSTTGEVTALLTPATQNRPVAVTTAAHTINGGALVAGDVVYGSCEVDATATTSAQMTDFRLWGNVLVTLSANSLSD